MSNLVVNVAVHNSGGIGTDQYASSAHVTPEQISRYHRKRWEHEGWYPSEYVHDESVNWSGYTLIITRDGKRVWCRAIGEQTAAQRGYNHNTVAICVLGNYNKRPIGSPAGTVDEMTVAQKACLNETLIALAEHRFHDIEAPIVPGTTIRLSAARIQPHRFFQKNTQCYGTGLADNWAKNIVLKHYAQKYNFPASIVSLFVSFLDSLRVKYPAQFGSNADERSCEGVINI